MQNGNKDGQSRSVGMKPRPTEIMMKFPWPKSNQYFAEGVAEDVAIAVLFTLSKENVGRKFADLPLIVTGNSLN